METTQVVSVSNAEHYKWAQVSDGWHLLKQDDLSVIEELMPPGSFEQLHFHAKARQLFYILSGEAIFTIGESIVSASAGESVHVPATTPHKIINNSKADLRFIVVSAPKAHGDRIDL